MNSLLDKSKEFRRKLAELPREDLLELVQAQDPKLLKDVKRIEGVFKHKLSHLTWADGTPIDGRIVTNEELALLIDEPFELDPDLTQMGISVEQQRQLHIAKDPVTWARSFLKAEPFAFQVMMLRDPAQYKVLRAGRRLGKSWMMAVMLLHYSYTTKNGRSLVMTPMLSQAKLIFEEMIKLAKKSETVISSITRHVLNPNPEIAMTNGSTVRFFTSGMKTGGKADGTRGQEAHLIVLDEVDYMGDEDLEAIYAMLQKTSEVQVEKRLIGASTPSGRQAIFYKWCTAKDSQFKEFYFPSYVNRFWNQETEDFLRAQNSEMGYRHEVEADWGESVDGVYPKRFVDNAFNSGRLRFPEVEPDTHSDWPYNPVPEDPTSTYIIGVDWDKYGAGTNIVVLEMFSESHPERFLRGKIRMCHREEITKEEYLLTKAVERIIELNKIFRPKHIYIDKGYGEVQYELLKKYGVDNPSSGLNKKVKGVNSSESIEIRDPHTREKIKKEIKLFMVDNLTQLLEKQMIFFPSHDEDLYAQFLHYVVVRTTVTGRPVFGMSSSIGDHVHDALILACLAIAENYGELMQVSFARQALVISNEAFLPLFSLSDNEEIREGEEVLVDRAWGDKSGAPVSRNRPLTYNLRSNRGTIKRRRF